MFSFLLSKEQPLYFSELQPNWTIDNIRNIIWKDKWLHLYHSCHANTCVVYCICWEMKNRHYPIHSGTQYMCCMYCTGYKFWVILWQMWTEPLSYFFRLIEVEEYKKYKNGSEEWKRLLEWNSQEYGKTWEYKQFIRRVFKKVNRFPEAARWWLPKEKVQVFFQEGFLVDQVERMLSELSHTLLPTLKSEWWIQSLSAWSL